MSESITSTGRRGRKRHRSLALTRDEGESKEDEPRIEPVSESKYIGWAIYYTEYGYGIITQYWPENKQLESHFSRCSKL